MDPSANVRAGFLLEVCRSLDQSGGGGGYGSGGGGADVAAAAAAGAAGGGAWTLRFMAYLCLAAFEVRRTANSKQLCPGAGGLWCQGGVACTPPNRAETDG